MLLDCRGGPEDADGPFDFGVEMNAKRGFRLRGYSAVLVSGEFAVLAVAYSSARCCVVCFGKRKKGQARRPTQPLKEEGCEVLHL